MIDAYPATLIILLFLAIWGVMFPLLGVLPKVREMVSLRYLTVIVWLAVLIGVIVNFSELSDTIKLAVVISAAVMSGLFVAVRSFEKVQYTHDLHITAQKGEAKAEIELKGRPDIKPVELKDDLRGLAEREQNS